MDRRKREMIVWLRQCFHDAGVREWSIRPTGGGHFLIDFVTAAGAKRSTTFAKTPSDHRSMRNKHAEVLRVLRGEERRR